MNRVPVFCPQAFTSASQGFLNCLVYGWTRARLRRAGRTVLSRDVDTQTPLLRSQKKRSYQALPNISWKTQRRADQLRLRTRRRLCHLQHKKVWTFTWTERENTVVVSVQRTNASISDPELLRREKGKKKEREFTARGRVTKKTGFEREVTASAIHWQTSQVVCLFESYFPGHVTLGGQLLYRDWIWGWRTTVLWVWIILAGVTEISYQLIALFLSLSTKISFIWRTKVTFWRHVYSLQSLESRIFFIFCLKKSFKMFFCRSVMFLIKMQRRSIVVDCRCQNLFKPS